MEAQLLEAIAPSSISLLPSIIVTSEERASFVKEFKQRQTTYRARAAQFIEQSTKSDAQFIAFVHNVEDAWRNYIRLIEHADTLSPNLHNLYPEKTYLLSQLTEGMYTLNQHLYFITDVEKEIYERMFERIPPDRLETFLASIVSFPIYLSSNIASTEIEQTTPSAARALAQRNSYAGALLRSCGGSVELFQNALRDAGTLQRDVHHEQFIPENDVERALQTIVAYDHFVELFLRKSRLIELDIAFYAMLARRLNVLPQHNDIINALEQLKTKQGREFSYPIPGYSQSALSCGVACLLNAANAFDKRNEANSTIELAILSEVTAPGFDNNLPSCLAHAATTHYQIPATFIADMKTFAPLYLENPAVRENPPVRKFLNFYERIDKKDVSANG